MTLERRLETDEPDGDIKKTMMKMQRTAPRRRVEGLAFFRRTDPMGRAMETICGQKKICKGRGDGEDDDNSR